MKFEQRNITSLENDGTYLDMRKNDIKDMIDGNWYLTNHEKEDTIIHFEGMKDFYLLKGADFVLFFDTKEERQKVIELLEENFEPNGDIWSAEKESGIQSPRVIGPFEYKNKIGLWIEAKNPLTEITSTEKGIYKGVIINPNLYYSASKEANDLQSKIQESANTAME
ncbi:hypothetical protein CSB09_01700 [Candidatus Gracilibacteria bacterium]|nr:MAG: hypothetical protein CSB09_01700 [Candidatus Gracilibacteria bacterium]